MGKECIVVGCTNRDTDKQEGLKFHRLPKQEYRRKLWLQAINRKNPSTGEFWIPRDDGARVCSEHFIEGKVKNFLSLTISDSIKFNQLLILLFNIFMEVVAVYRHHEISARMAHSKMPTWGKKVLLIHVVKYLKQILL